jgi:hypothetical protein
MLCGGSGITPILQVLKGVIEDPEDTETEMWCIDANKSIEDIRECSTVMYEWNPKADTNFMHENQSVERN